MTLPLDEKRGCFIGGVGKGRIGFIDIAKGVAITAIVYGHLVYPNQWQYYVFSFHVPMFFLLGGLVYHRSRDGFSRFLTKKVRGLLVPYWVVGLLSIFVYIALGSFAGKALDRGALDLGFWSNFGKLLYGNANVGLKFNTPLWFLPAYFILLMIYYFWDKFLALFKRDSLYRGALLLSILFFVVLGWWNLRYGGIEKLPFGLETSVCMLPFFITGVFLREIGITRFADRTGRTAVFLLPVVVAFLAAGFFLFTKNSQVVYVTNQYGAITIFYLSALLTTLGYLFLSVVLGRNRVLEYVGRSTLMILLIHKFPILFFQTILPVTKVGLKNNDRVIEVVSLVLVILISLAVNAVYLSARGKVETWGKSRRKEQGDVGEKGDGGARERTPSTDN